MIYWLEEHSRLCSCCIGWEILLFVKYYCDCSVPAVLKSTFKVLPFPALAQLYHPYNVRHEHLDGLVPHDLALSKW